MGTPGVPWDVPEVTIVAALKKHMGKVTYAAADLKCCAMTLRRYLRNNPHLNDLVADLRIDLDHMLCDSAEHVLGALLDNARKDATNALKSAMYVLNNKGKERGYQPITGDIVVSKETLAKFDDTMKQVAKAQNNQSDLNNASTISSNETKSE